MLGVVLGGRCVLLKLSMWWLRNVWLCRFLCMMMYVIVMSVVVLVDGWMKMCLLVSSWFVCMMCGLMYMMCVLWCLVVFKYLSVLVLKVLLFGF